MTNGFQVYGIILTPWTKVCIESWEGQLTRSDSWALTAWILLSKVLFKLAIHYPATRWTSGASKNRDCPRVFFFLHLSSLVSELFLVPMVCVPFLTDFFDGFF